jgi:hypothetical protein
MNRANVPFLAPFHQFKLVKPLVLESAIQKFSMELGGVGD